MATTKTRSTPIAAPLEGEGPPAPLVWHALTAPRHLPGHDAIVATLELVARELAPRLATFFRVDEAGQIVSSTVHGGTGAPDQTACEVQRWKHRLRSLDPLAPAVVAGLPRRVVTLRDVGGPRRAVLSDQALYRLYRGIGMINDLRMLIRDEGRLVAGVTLWRPFGSSAWQRADVRRLEALQPLVSTAYLSSARRQAVSDERLPATLTPRQREVARLLIAGASNCEIASALCVTEHTAKSHARVVLAQLGAANRRELVVRYADA